MATLQDVLNDKNNYADDIEITIGTEKLKLGEIRGFTAKEKKELSESLQAAKRDREQAAEVSTKAAEIYNTLDALSKKAADDAAKRQPSGEEDDFETNNWWTPVRKRMTAQEKQIQDAVTAVKTLTDSFTKAATMFATERWNNQYERVAPRLKKSKDYADWDVTKLREYATKNQIVDEFGFPSVEKAAQTLTRADDLEEVRREAYEKGKKEAEQRLRLASQARPTSATGGKLPKGKSAVEEMGLEGLGDDVMGDEELMDMLGKAQASFDPNSLQ